MKPQDMTKAANRSALLAAIRQVAESFGASVDVRPEDRGAHIELRLGPVRTSTWVDASTAKVGAFLWHFRLDRPFRFAPEFAPVINGTVNQFHGGKATLHSHDSDQMLFLLRAALLAAQTGAAFVKA